MKIKSFKIRLMLLSVTLSGLVLAAFGAAGWLFVYSIGLDRIDREIKGIGHRELTRPRPTRQWKRLEHALQYRFGEERDDSIILSVRKPRGGTVHTSTHWPEKLSTGTFPDPEKYMRSTQRPPYPPPDLDDGPPPLSMDRGASSRRAAGPPHPRGKPGAPPRPPKMGALPPRPIAEPVFHTVKVGSRSWRIGVMGNPRLTMLLGINLENFNSEMQQVRNAFFIALPVALLLIAAGGWLLAQRALRPVRKLTGTAERITARGLDRRIPLEGEGREFLRLITVFNRMMDRIEKSFGQAVRFSADAAHELKTPLTILQGQLEQALQGATDGSAEQRTYSGLLEEVQRLRAITRKLLLLSRADAGQLNLVRERLNLSNLVEGVFEDTLVLAPELEVKKEIQAGLWVKAEADLIGQVLHNMTSNAMKYNREGGSIVFSLRVDGPNLRFSISNTGEAIPREDRSRIFERFYRADRSHSRRVDGVGLGLSLAREIARAHDGDLVLEDTRNRWATFTMTLPRA